MEKTFEEFRFRDIFKSKTNYEKYEKYINILEDKYKEYKKFQIKVKYGTKKDGSFSEFVSFLNFFKRYLKKIFNLKDDVIGVRLIDHPEISENVLVAKYFNEIAEGIDTFEHMDKISSYIIYDVKDIYEFYNEYAPIFNKERKKFNWRDTSNGISGNSLW